MRSSRRLRHLVPVIAATALCVGAGPAAAADTTIGFEDLADGTAVGTQYSALGVQLDPPAALHVATNSPAHDGTKVLRATDLTCAPGSTISFTGLMSTPRTTVGIWVRSADPMAHTVTLQTFDAANAETGSTNLSITSGLGWQQLLLPTTPGSSIDHFTVSAESGICELFFDDLSFDAPVGAEPPSVAWEDVAAQPVAVERGAATATTATLRRKGGSTGRVDLSVAGLPTGVSAVVAPAQANGADLRSPVTITLTGAADAPATPAPVQVTLRATPVDGTAGTPDPIEATFPLTVQPPFVSLALTAPAPTDLYRRDAPVLAAQLVRHSLSSGRIALTATAPTGVTVTVSPAAIDGAAPTTPVSVAITVAPSAPRSPAGSIRLVATSDDAAAAPPGQEAELRVAAPVRIPELAITNLVPSRLVLRAGAGTSRVDARITAIDLPASTVISSGVQSIPRDVEVDAGPTSWRASDGSVLFKANLTARSGLTSASTQVPSIWARAEIPGRPAVSGIGFFDLTVVPTIRYALAARGIEVTQGVQTLGAGGCSSIPTRDISHIDSSVPYKGVRLVDGDLTVARVFVSAWLLTNTKSLPKVGVRLHGFRGGKEIPGSPLSPIGAPAGVTSGDISCVSDADRTGAENIYTYALPPTWTFGSVTLRAEILPIPPTASGSVLDECGSLFCQTFKRFTLRSIGFTRLRWPGIKPLRVTGKGNFPVNADAALYPARMLHPGEPGVWSYQGDIDITDLIDAADVVAGIPAFAALSRRDIIEGGLSQRVRAWAQVIGDRSIVAGIAPTLDSVFGAANGRSIADLPSSPFNPRPSMVGITSRPLTSMTHELGHLLQRKHAGQACPGTGPDDDQAGDPWLPDDQGLLQGIGLDLWSIAPNAAGFTATGATPYRVIARNVPNSAAEFYDLMSYCASTSEVDVAGSPPNSWLSPRGWDAEVASLEAWTKKTGGAIGIASRAAAATDAVLTVSAIGRGASTAILAVEPGTGTPAAPGAAGPVLVGYDEAGAEVTRAGLADEVLEDTGLHTYSGSVLGARVARVAIVDQQGAQLADRAQSVQAPTVAVTAPRAGATVGGTKPVRVAWTARDGDGDRLVTTVEASADDGRTWRRISQGQATSTALPAAYFAASTKARIRVTVNDGFRATSAVSGRFTALRAPATVRIDMPRPRTKLDSDASLTLTGSASTLTGPVASGRLVWRLDGRQIARGARTAVRNLPPGRRVLSLGVRGDAKAGARVIITVRAVTPRYLRVSVPSRVSSTARSVVVRLRSGAAATVRSGGRQVRIKARGRGVLRIPIRPGRDDVVLTLTARALGSDSTFTRVVRR